MYIVYNIIILIYNRLYIVYILCVCDCVNKECLINNTMFVYNIIVPTCYIICGLLKTRTENGRRNSKGNDKKVKLVSITGSYIYYYTCIEGIVKKYIL